MQLSSLKRAMKLTTASILAMACAGVAQAQFVIDPELNVTAGTRPGGIAVIDADNDGDLDIAVTVDNPDRIVFLINTGGTFAPGASVILPNSSSPGELVAGDLDGDGDADLAVILRDLNTVMAVINNGGAFSTGAQASVGANARGLDIADMDNDGDLDLVVANRDSNTATVLANNGNATFVSITLTTGIEPRAASFGDFDNDGDQDIAVTNHDDRTISVFTQSGGAFVLSATLNTTDRPEDITCVDLDGDGDDDIAVAAGPFVRIFRSGGGGFSGPFSYGTGLPDGSNIHAVDIDCDDALDLVVTDSDVTSVATMRNTGAAAFVQAGTLTAGAHPDEIASGDLDGDGDADLVVANRDSNSVSIFFNDSCQDDPGGGGPCVADITDANGGGPDGSVDIFDLVRVLQDWGPCPQ